MRAIVSRSEIEGTLDAPPSKSFTHRAIVCGLLSSASVRIRNPLYCDDTESSIRLSEQMGAMIDRGVDLEVTGPDILTAPSSDMDCRGSGTTLRIFTALSALANGRCVLTGDSTLLKRPISEMLSALRQLGVLAKSLSGEGRPPVEVHGHGLSGGVVDIRGDVTSQYITGLLFACSRARGETRINITTHLESRPYVEMTLDVMNRFGVLAKPTDEWSHIDISGDQQYKASEYEVPGDYSSAAFILAAGSLTGRAVVRGLRAESKQGDAEIINYLKLMGASIESTSDGFAASRNELTSMTVDASNTPDLVPILAVLASQANGVTQIYNARRLRFKESDRLATTSSELSKMGASIIEVEDGLVIKGPTPLRGAVVNPHDDHRIAMACIVAGLIAEGTTVVENSECVDKSYPSFIEHIRSLGARVDLQSTKDASGGRS
ncbi:MAG: 3-phosphoshikimate 1-carboxyvinyltransferase [Promethearchaeota archaeon]